MATSNIFLGTTSQGKISFNFSSTNLSLGNNGTDVINIASNENVGVGFLNSLTPVYKLDVSGGNINTDSNYKIEGTDVLTSDTLGVGITSSSLESVGNLSDLTVVGDLTVDTNTLFVNSSNARVGINTTAPTVELDVIGSATISNNVLIEGDLTVNGTMTTFNTENVIIEDPLITLANNNTSDTIDSGVYSIYNDGTTKYAGYFRDATDGVYKFFEELEVEPTTTVDTGATGYTEASILVNTVTASNMIVNTVSISNDLAVDTDTLYVNATNNTVGIGITNPTESLEVIGNIGVSGNIVPKLGDVFDLGTTSVRFRDLYLSGNTIHLDAAQISGNDSGTISLNAGLIVDTNTLSVDASTNNIGIGITNPSEKLDVIGNINASTGSSFKINNTDVITSTGLGSAVVSSSLTSVGTLTSLDVTGVINSSTAIQVNNVNVIDENSLSTGVTESNLQTVGALISLDITGNLLVDTNTLSVDASTNSVGIGITNPSEVLDVVGNINASSGNTFKINNTDVITSTGLGSGIISSSLTSVGSLTSLDVTGNLIVDTNTLSVDASSNSVGIGITNPSTYLNIGISDSSSTSQFLIQNDSIDASAGLSFNTGNFDFNISLDGNSQIATFENTNGDIDIKANDTGNINFYTTDLDDNRLTILNNGNIGISNSAPSYKLDVNGDLNFTGNLRNNGTIVSAGEWAASGDDIYNGNVGNVGIGTTAPAQLLSISGNILSSYSGSAGIEIIPTDLSTDSGGRIYYREGGTDNFGFSVGYNGGNTGSELLNWAANTFNIARHESDATGAPVITIQRADGFVGIGVTAPTTELEVDGTATFTKIFANDEIRFAGDTGANALIQKNASAGRDELQIYVGGDAFGSGSKGGGIHLYGISDSQHTANIAFITGDADAGDGRMIISQAGNVSISAGATTGDNSLFDYVDNNNDTAALNFNNVSGRPCILFDGVATTDGELAVPTGEAFAIGHWTGSVFTTEFYLNSTGDVGVGNTAPDTRFHITEDITGDARLTIENNDGTNTNTAGIAFGTDSTQGKVTGLIENIKNATNNHSLTFHTYNGTLTSQMTIASNGAINTSSNLTVSSNITSSSGNITATTGDIIASSGNITATDGDVKADVVTGEVYTGVCQTIGTLGYILLDQQSLTGMGDGTYDVTVDFDNQSTDTYALYKMFLTGFIDGDGGGDYIINARFIDTVGTISTSAGYYTEVYVASSTTALVDTTATVMNLLRIGSSTTVRRFLGEYTVSLSSTPEDCKVLGGITTARGAGSSSNRYNIAGGLTSASSITTRITGMTFAYVNSNVATNNPLRVRVFRLL